MPTNHLKSFSASQAFSSTFFATILLSLHFSTFVSALAINKGTASTNGTIANVPHEGTSFAGSPGHGVEKRADNARFTFYETGLGACGGWNNPTDFVRMNVSFVFWTGGMTDLLLI